MSGAQRAKTRVRGKQFAQQNRIEVASVASAALGRHSSMFCRRPVDHCSRMAARHPLGFSVSFYTDHPAHRCCIELERNQISLFSATGGFCRADTFRHGRAMNVSLRASPQQKTLFWRRENQAYAAIGLELRTTNKGAARCNVKPRDWDRQLSAVLRDSSASGFSAIGLARRWEKTNPKTQVTRRTWGTLRGGLAQVNTTCSAK